MVKKKKKKVTSRNLEKRGGSTDLSTPKSDPTANAAMLGRNYPPMVTKHGIHI